MSLQSTAASFELSNLYWALKNRLNFRLLEFIVDSNVSNDRNKATTK